MTVQGEQADTWADWYVVGDANLEQGDIFLSFPVVTPLGLDESGSYTFAEREQPIVVLTQTCDLPKPKQRTLIAASVQGYDALVATGEFDYLKDSKYKEALARGSAVADFLLPPTPGTGLPWSIVHFRDLFVVPKQSVVDAATTHAPIRLASPYKEYLSQAFAGFLMRVAWPSTLNEFTERDSS